MNGGPITDGVRPGTGRGAAADGPDAATAKRLHRGWIDRLTYRRPRRDLVALALVLSCQLVLATAYARATPPWETPDEPWHMGYVTWLRATHRLPPLTAEMLDTPLRQEASQAPLYYVLAAAAALPWSFGSDDLARAFVENPTRFKGVGLAPRQHNYALHGPWDDPTVPIIRALRAARAVAALFGLLAAWATWRLARTLRPDRPWFAVAAGAWVAFTPQVLFLSAAASNDTAVAALATLALTAAIAFPDRPGDGAAARLGAWYGLAALAKSSALALGPIVAVGVVFGAWRSRSSRGVVAGVVRWGAISLAAAMATGGWWYLRNLAWYGTLFGRSLHLAMPWAHRVPHSLARLARDDAFDLLFMSYWGVFGWGTVRYPRWVYDGAQFVVAAAAVGGVVAGAAWWRARRVRGTGERGTGDGGGTGVDGDGGGGVGIGERMGDGRPWWGYGLCGAWSAVSIVTLIVWMRQVEANWGRLLFPALGALTVLIVAGLARLAPRGTWSAVALGGLVVWSVSGPAIALRSAYGPPRYLSEEEVRALDDRVDWRMGDAVTLLSFSALEPTAANPGFWPVRLCWQAIRRPDFEPSAFVHVVGAADAIVASYDGTPGGGTWPGGAWRPGEAVCERIEVAIGQPEQPVPAPAVYRVAVGMFDRDSQERMATVDRDGMPVIGNFVGHVKVRGDGGERSEDFVMDDVRFGDNGVDIRLVDTSAVPESVCAGETLTFTLMFNVDAPPAEDLQLLVHLRPVGSTTAVSQADGPVMQAGLPYPSSAWARGEHLADVRTLDVPPDTEPGAYVVAVGFYRLSDGMRQSVRVSGTDVPDRTYELRDRIEVRPCP